MCYHGLSIRQSFRKKNILKITIIYFNISLKACPLYFTLFAIVLTIHVIRLKKKENPSINMLEKPVLYYFKKVKKYMEHCIDSV